MKQVRFQKQLDFVDRQLREFYSPLLGYEREIRAKSELRSRISSAARQAWREMPKVAPGPSFDMEKAYAPFGKIIEYNNKQLTEELLPLYGRMVELFKEKFYLAEPETAVWYNKLSDFVDLWNRWLTGSIPPEVMEKLGHQDIARDLNGFWQELELRHGALRKKLAVRDREN